MRPDRSDPIRRLGAEIRAKQEPAREFSAAQIIGGILDATRDGATEIGSHLLRLLASWYPEDYERLERMVEVANEIHTGGRT